jgi:uncharacterized protein (DUF2147 family)
MKKIAKTTVFSIVFLLCISNAFAQSNIAVSGKIIGVYWSPKKDAKIEIYKRGDQYFGRSIWLANPKNDAENPDSRLRKRALLGLDLLTGFSYEDGIYTNGKIYDPESGKTYSCKMSFSGQNLKVRGYIGISMFGRTEIFERVL